MNRRPAPSGEGKIAFRSAKVACLLALVLSVVAGCQSPTAPPPADQSKPRPVTLALNWFPEAEHGGFYAALVHGYYDEEGLDVTILPGGPGAPVIQQVATGRVDFAVANADQVLLGRDQGAPVVAVMTAMQDSPRCIMVHEKSGINSLLELKDMTLAVGSGKPFSQFLLKRLGDAGLTVVPYQGNVALFLERDDVAQQAYVFSEPFMARQQGAEPKCLMVSELGFNPYTSLLITSDSRVADEAELVGKMVRATVRGWRKYLADPAETNQYIHEQNREMTPEILAYGAEAIGPLCLPAGADPGSLGRMTAERWEALAGQLVEIELLNQPDVWKQAYALEFLPAK